MKFIRLIIIVFFCFPLSIFADTGNIMVECPKNVKKGEIVDCHIKAYSLYEVSAVEYGFELPNNVEKNNVIVDSIWQGTEEDNLFLLYTDVNKKDVFNIGVINLKALDNIESINIKTTRLIYTDSLFNERIIVENNVKQTENKKEKQQDKKNNYSKYVIIILIIGVLVVGIMFVKIRSGKHEK